MSGKARSFVRIALTTTPVAPFIWSDARVHVNVAGGKARLRKSNRRIALDNNALDTNEANVSQYAEESFGFER